MRNELKENNRRLRKNRELIEYDLPHCLDFFALLLRDGAKTEYELIKAFNLALMECSNVAIRMMFFARERLKDVETYKLLLKFLANYHPSIMSKTVRFVPEHGCAEDLLILVGSPSENALGKYLRRRLTEQKMCNIFQGRKILNHYHDYQNMFLLSSDVLRIVIWLAKLDQERDLEKIKIIAKLLKMELNEYAHFFQQLWSMFRGVWNYYYPKEPISVPNKVIKDNPVEKFTNRPKLFETPNKYEEWQNMILPNLRELFENKNFNAKNFYKTPEIPEKHNKPSNEMICKLMQKFYDYRGCSPYEIKSMEYICDSDLGAGNDNKTLVAINPSYYNSWGRDEGVRNASAGIALILCTANNLQDCFAGSYISPEGEPSLMSVRGNNFVEKVRYINNETGREPVEFDSILGYMLYEAKKHKIPREAMPETVVFMAGAYKFTRNFDKSAQSSLKKRFLNAGYNFPKLIFWDSGMRKRCYAEAQLTRVVVEGFSPKLFERFAHGQIYVLAHVMFALAEFGDIIRTNDKFGFRKNS